MSRFVLSPAQLAAFQSDGYIVVPNLLDHEETDMLRTIAKADHELQRDAGSRADGEGGARGEEEAGAEVDWVWAMMRPAKAS